VALLTVSDSRTEKTDVNAAYLREQLAVSQHFLADYRLVKDDPKEIALAIEELTKGPAQVILINGGSGISQRDNTTDVVNHLLEKRLPGFGEIFRSLSYRQVGSAAMLSRATAGLYRECVLFSMPGSPGAVKLAWEELIEPELTHVAYEVSKG
jgi:molybdenum cofactor biosynthesis protein B